MHANDCANKLEGKGTKILSRIPQTDIEPIVTDSVSSESIPNARRGGQGGDSSNFNGFVAATLNPVRSGTSKNGTLFLSKKKAPKTNEKMKKDERRRLSLIAAKLIAADYVLNSSF